MEHRVEPQLRPPDGLVVPPRARVPEAPPPRRRLRIGSVILLILWLPILAILLVPATVLVLRWLPPPTTAFMLQSETRPVSYKWVPADQIADHARRAVVAAEDQKFWQHDGFDMEAIEKAIAHNQRSRRKRGASTISQQTAKNLFLWPGGGYFRKGVEAGMTLLLESMWSKERILEVYLNIAEFGPGIYGVEAASQAYFGKPARSMTPEEAARLAAVLPSPRRWRVRAPGPYVQLRANWILRQMGYGRRGDAEDEPEPLDPEEELLLPETEAGLETPTAPFEPELQAPQPVEAESFPQAAPLTTAPPPSDSAPVTDVVPAEPAQPEPVPEPQPEPEPEPSGSP